MFAEYINNNDTNTISPTSCRNTGPSSQRHGGHQIQLLFELHSARRHHDIEGVLGARLPRNTTVARQQPRYCSVQAVQNE